MLVIPELSDEDLVFIYGFGLSGKWLSNNISAKILGFIDTDYKKVGQSFNGLNVFSVDQAAQLGNNNIKILVTVIDINDVLPILRRIPHQSWFALGKYLENVVVSEPFASESAEFIEYALKAVEVCHKGYLDKNRLFLRSVDLVITEKCSLKCKDCSNLMQYYEAPKDIPLAEIIADFDKLMQSVDHIYEIRLIGGEPFMNKEIYKVIEYIVTHEKLTKLVVFSNAMIPIKPEYAHILQHPKIVFSLTDYGDLAKNTPRVVQSLDKLKIAYRLHKPENWTDSGVIHDFARTPEENVEIFDQCCGKNLYTVTAGKLYRCPFAANADRLQAIPPDQANSVAVDASSEEIRHYVSEINVLPACNFCKGRSFGAPEIEAAIQTKQPLKYKKFSLQPVA